MISQMNKDKKISIEFLESIIFYFLFEELIVSHYLEKEKNKAEICYTTAEIKQLKCNIDKSA